MDLSKPTPRYASFSTVDKSKFFLWGGRELEGLNSPKALLYYFDFCNEEWNRRYLIGLLPPGFNFGSCARNGNFLYVYGGEDEDGYYTGSLFEINIETASSTKLSTTSTITPLEKNDSGMVIYKGKVILFGGKSQDPDRRTNELHSYDIPTGSWSQPMVTGDIPPPCSNFSFTRLNEDTVVLFGGYLGDDVYSDEVYTLNLTEMNWTKISHKSEETWPSPRRAHTASVLGYGSNHAEIIIIGGKRDTETLDEIWKLDPIVWKWKKLSPSCNEIFRRRWHMSGSRQISPDFCEIIVFGGIQGRKIIAETALLIFQYDSWEKTWFIKEVVDSEKLGSSDRIQRKALQSQMYVSLKPNDPLKEEEKKEAGMVNYNIWIPICIALLAFVLFNYFILYLFHLL